MGDLSGRSEADLILTLNPSFHRIEISTTKYSADSSCDMHWNCPGAQVICTGKSLTLIIKKNGNYLSNWFDSKHRPKLLHISDIAFHRAVNVGSLIKMHSHVTFTERNYMQIVVYAEVFDPHTGLHSTSNMFHYTFESSEPVVRVMPKSYHGQSVLESVVSKQLTMLLTDFFFVNRSHDVRRRTTSLPARDGHYVRI